MEFTRYSSLSGSNVAFVAGRLTTRQASWEVERLGAGGRLVHSKA